MDLMMNEFKQLALAMGIALILVLAVVAWKSFPSKDVYISDMDFEVVKFEWTQPQRDKSIAGSSMIINEKYYEKGLAMHAHSEANVPVPAGYTHFLAEVGVDDAMKDDAPSSVQFQVLGDGVVLYESPILRASMPAHRVLVNVEWISQLTLVVNDGGDGANSDHADWAGARFTVR